MPQCAKLIVDNINTIYKINLTRIAGGIAAFLSLIPWVSFGLLGGDSMPWAFLGYLFFFLSFKTHTIKTPKNFTKFLFFLICGICVAFIMSDNIFHENTFRSLYNYLSVVVIYLGFLNYLLRYSFPIQTFIAVNILWLLFSVFELFFPDIASNFSTIRAGEPGGGRGVTSLAPEPTFFGMYLFFSSWLMIVGSNYKPGRYLMYLLFCNLIFIFLIAKASMIIIYLILSLFLFLAYGFIRLKWKKRLIKHTAIACVFFIIGGFFIYNEFEGSRYMNLLNKILQDSSLSNLFFIDASLNNRLEHIVYSIHGAVNNFLLPAGFDAFFHMKDKLDITYNYYFWYGQPSYKIMSWSGDWLFQLGVFGLIFVSYLFYISSDGSRMRRTELLLLAIILFSAIPIAFPLIPMLLALYTYQCRIRTVNKIMHKEY